MTLVGDRRCLHELFDARVSAAPDAVAVVHGADSLTYRELHTRAAGLASVLRGLGVGPDVLVGLYLPRSVEMVVGMLAVLSAGGAYLPLPPGDPVERTRFVLADSAAAVVLTSAETDASLDGLAVPRVPADARHPAAPAGRPPAVVTSENLAYVLYTSGTTGRPKGVAVPHRAVTRILRDGAYADFDASQTFLQTCPLSFDASVFEIWGALAHGARLVLLPDRHVTVEAIADAVDRYRVTALWLTPTLFNRMVDDDLLQRPGLRQVVVGGELLSSPHVARALRSTTLRVANAYGPTEAGVFACCGRLQESDLDRSPPPVGRPLAGTEIRILGDDLRPVPDGEVGELCIGGDAPARGYHRRPGLTARAFVPDPLGGPGRLYRSGDHARVLPGGAIQVLGRIDGQVKIRGNRVELGEVESALATDPAVRQVAVVDRTHGAERVLAAHLVPADGSTPEVAALRARLAGRLPDYMIPSRWYRVDRLPVTTNGKVDRAALRAGTGAVELATGGEFAQASGELQTLMVRIWRDVLDVPAVGVDDNYFDLGGTSLSIHRVRQRVQEALGAPLPLTALYEYPTVRELATAITNAEV